MDVADLVQPGGERLMRLAATRLARHWLRHPALHFVLLGAALLLVYRAREPEPEPPSRRWQAPIVITADQVQRMEATFRDRWGGAPTEEQRRALINAAVEEELLYRQARALALEYQDASVRRRLFEKARALELRVSGDSEDLVDEAVALGLDDDVVIRRLLAEKMRLVLQQDTVPQQISDAELAHHLERHRERFLQPETVTFTHVFLATDAHRQLGTAAQAARAALGAQPPSVDSARLSDPFPLGNRFVALTPTQLTGRFGKPFTDRLLTLPIGAWSEPIASPFGLHLVWIEQHKPASLPPLDAVREPILLELTKARAADNLARGLAQLRSLYEIRIEHAAS
jgi:hypothetical protein